MQLNMLISMKSIRAKYSLSKYIRIKMAYLKSKPIDLVSNIYHVITSKKLSPRLIIISPTNVCNANCIFCAYQYYKKPKINMDIDILKKTLYEAKVLSIPKIGITPLVGEILTDKTIINKLKIIGSYKFDSVTAFTNLLGLHKFDTGEFINIGITGLHVSTSPLRKELYEKIYRNKKYDIFLKNLINLLKEFNLGRTTIKTITIEFRSSLSLKDCLELDDFQKHIKPLIKDNVKVNAITKFDSWMGAIKKEDLLDGMTLEKPAGKKIVPCWRLSNIQVLSNGDIRVCGCRFNSSSGKDIFYIGNMKTVSIEDAYNSDTVKNLKKSFLKNNPPYECQICSWYC